MSVTDDDQFAAYGGGNYDYLAMGPSSFGFVTMASGNEPNFRIGCSAGGNVYGVFGYAGPGRDDGNTIGPAARAAGHPGKARRRAIAKIGAPAAANAEKAVTS
jgi:hypothetical protein